MFSDPVKGDRFFGREEVLELLTKRASALKEGYRQNVALTGQSLAGKSSIILHFLHTIQSEGFTPVYVEVVKEPFRSFANKFIATLLYNALAKKGESVSVDIERLLAKAQEILPKMSAAIRQIYSLIDGEEFDEAYASLLGLTSTLKAETGAPCIVILDEFDNLEHLGIKNPYLGFGKVIMVQKDTMYIVSSSRDAAIKKIISEKLSLLFGNFEVVKVSNFDVKASARFIEMKLAGFEVEDFAKQFLIAFTDGNPFYLDKLVTCARNIAFERMSSYTDNGVFVEAIYQTIYNSNGVIHQYLMNYLLDLLDSKHKDQHLSILIAIASGHTKQAEIAKALRAKQADISKALVRLVELGLISKNGVFYKLDDAMLGFWLKHVYRRRKELLVDGTLDKESIFTQEIAEHMAAYARAFGMDIVSRLGELFNAFSNELVQIDLKNMKMPHFTKVEVRAFGLGKRYVAASFRGTFWIIQPYESSVSENDIIEYMRNTKSLGIKMANKVIVPLRGLDENSKLLAKELRIAIWDSPTVNTLLDLYGKKRIIIT